MAITRSAFAQAVGPDSQGPCHARRRNPSLRRLFEPESFRSHLIVKGEHGGYGHAGRNLYAATGSDGAGEQGIRHPEHVSVRAHHLAGADAEGGLTGLRGQSIRRRRTGNVAGAKSPAILHCRRGRRRTLATTSRTLKIARHNRYYANGGVTIDMQNQVWSTEQRLAKWVVYGVLAVPIITILSRDLGLAPTLVPWLLYALFATPIIVLLSHSEIGVDPLVRWVLSAVIAIPGFQILARETGGSGWWKSLF
jgi:hypothetical protein